MYRVRWWECYAKNGWKGLGILGGRAKHGTRQDAEIEERSLAALRDDVSLVGR
jgi:hypothetical protein